MYFLVHGTVGFVLPRYSNRIYKEILQGDHFGHSELVSDMDFIDSTKITKLTKSQGLIRRFTVQAIENCEYLTLSTLDMLKMKLEFPTAFQEIVESGKLALKKELMLKL